MGGLWGSFWGHLGVFSRVLLARPFRKRFWSRSGALRGGPWGVKMTILIGRGVENQHFRPFALEPISGALPEPFWARFGTPNGTKFAPEALPEPTLRMCFEKDAPKSPNWAPRALQDPPKIPPIRAQEAPKTEKKGGKKGSKLRHPSRTPSGPRLGALLGPFWDHFRGHSGPVWGSVFSLMLGLFSEGFSQISLWFL